MVRLPNRPRKYLSSFSCNFAPLEQLNRKDSLSAMNKMFFVPFISIVILALDYYVWMAVKTAFRNSRKSIQRTAQYTFWGFTAFILLGIVSYNALPLNAWKNEIRITFRAIVMISVITKLFIIIFLLVEDITRFFRWGTNKIRKKDPSAISRHEFLSQAALAVGAVPAATFAFGILSGAHDYQIEKVSLKIALSAEEQQAWDRIKDRFHQSCKKSVAGHIKLLIDAEESWIQPALDDLLEELMARYNKEEIMVYATIQLYLSERLPYLKALLEKSKKEAYQIGVKLVRGAYIEKETARANLKQYANPVCSSKEATDLNFDQGLQLLLENLDQAAVFVGSHNEASTLKALEQMKQANIATNHPQVCFAHLYGMSDYISYNLSDQGYNVVKYLPYGPIKKVVPYLIRRAEENSSIANQTSRELELIRKEIKRRKHVQK